MSSADQNEIDALLAQVQAQADAVQANADAAPGAAADTLATAAADVAEIAGEMEPPSAVPGGREMTPAQDLMAAGTSSMATGEAGDVGRPGH